MNMHATELRAIYQRVQRDRGWPVGPGEWTVVVLFGAVAFSLAFVYGGYYS
jgi:hypothetical protein